MLLSSGLAYGNIQWTMGTAMVSKTWTYPVATPEITSRFGHVSNFRHNKAHQGLDLAGGVGEPAMAVASGGPLRYACPMVPRRAAGMSVRLRAVLAPYSPP